MSLKISRKFRSQPPQPAKRAGLIGLFLSLLGLVGCQSFGPSSCVQPEINGRVVAADTHQPLAGVRVIRVVPGQAANAGAPAKGAQMLQQDRPETTGADGSFLVPGQQYMTLFRRSTWWSVRLSFQAPGYITCQTNFSTGSFTNLPDGSDPVLNAGDILLQPLSK